MKVLSVFGTRPEAIKMAPVIQELRRRSEELQSVICVTAQHREMLDQVLGLFAIQPDYDLRVMEDNQTPTQVAAAVLGRLEPVLQREQPDWVLVQGDTTTVAAVSCAWRLEVAATLAKPAFAGWMSLDESAEADFAGVGVRLATGSRGNPCAACLRRLDESG